MGIESQPSHSIDEPQMRRVRVGIGTIFEQYEDPKKRIAEVIKRLEPFFLYIDKKIFPDERATEIKNALKACDAIKDKNEFLDAVVKILEPILDIKKQHADKFEEAQTRVMNEAGGLTTINRLLSYGKSGETMHIHAPPGETVSNKVSLYRDGMRKLAEIVRDDPEIKEITATSWIVAKHPSLFTRMEFTIKDVSEDFKRQHFANEEREIKRATISREEFLRKFSSE